MAALLWGSWAPDWLLGNKVSFDGANRIIYVHPEVTSLDIRADLYSGWVDWVVLRDNTKFLPAIRSTGYDPIGAGVFTGDTYFLINGWKLSIDLSKVRVTGVLFSDNYDTAYYTPELSAQYPATVSSLVSSSISYQNIVTAANPADIWSHSTRTLSTATPTAVENADAVWAHSFVNKLLTIAKFLGLK